MSSITDRAPLARLAAVLVPGALLALLATTVAGGATSAITADLGVDLVAGAWVTTSFLIAAAVGIALSGWLTDRWGVRTAWLAALGVFTAGGLASALAPDLTALTLARAVQGLGGGALEPIMLTALARAAGPGRMGRVMGTVGATMSLGPLLGPLAGSSLGDVMGWRWVLGAVAVLALAVLIASVVVLPVDRGEPSRLDLRGLLLLGGGSMLSLAGFARVGQIAGVDVTTVLLVLLGATLLVAYVRHAALRGPDAVVDLSPFSDRGFAPAVTIMGLLGAAIYPVFFGMPQFLVGAVGLSATQAGLVMLPFGAGTLLAMPLAGSLSDRVPATRLVVGGALLGGCGFAALAAGGPDSGVAVAVTTFVVGLGLGSIGGPTVSSLYRVLDPGQVGAGSATLFVVNQLGGALGVAVLVVWIGALGGTWDAAVGGRPFWAAVVTAAVVAVVATRLPRAQSTSP